MKRIPIILVFFAILATLLSSSETRSETLVHTRIPQEHLDLARFKQQKSQWCWAATTQLILSYYGVSTTQSKIVTDTYGYNSSGLPADITGTFYDIYRNLNRYVETTSGNRLIRTIAGRGQPVVETLIDEITNNHPILIGYRTKQGYSHNAVITGLVYTYENQQPTLQKIELFDPSDQQKPHLNKGKITYQAAEIFNAIQAFWYTRAI